MIQEIELKKNNLVKDKDGNIIKVESIGFNGINIGFDNMDCSGFSCDYKLEDIFGIELSEEILLKCPQLEKSDDYGDQKYFDVKGTRFWICLDHDDFSYGLYSDLKRKETITIDYIDCGVYLHTFQNLFYFVFMKGTELEINL